MSWVECRSCGEQRKVMSVFCPSDDGLGIVWKNPPCHACGASEWTQAEGTDPYWDQPEPVSTVE